MKFRWAFENERIPTPVRFGTEFKIPRKVERRRAAGARGKGIYSAAQIRRLLTAAERGVTGQRWAKGANTRPALRQARSCVR